MRARRRDIGTRCSGRSPSAPRSTRRRRALQAAGRAAGAVPRRCGSPLCRGRAPLSVSVEHVALGHAAAAAAARESPRDRSCCPPRCFCAAGIARRAAAGCAARRRRRCAAARRCGRRVRRRRRLRARLRLALRCRSCAITSLLVTVPPSPFMIFTSTPESRRRRLEHDLVGLDVDEVFVALDELAGLLVPRHQRRLGHRLRELRHFHFD